jgi:hypothetical protein
VGLREPACSTTAATGRVPQRGSGTPTTMAASMAGKARSAAAISPGAMFSPPDKMTSSRRPKTVTRPRASTVPRSPVVSAPPTMGPVMTSAPLASARTRAKGSGGAPAERSPG